MVGDDGNRVGRSLYVLAPLGEGKNDCKEFSVVDVIVSFGGEEGAGEIGTRMEITIGIAL